MTGAPQSLILDLVEWVAKEPRPYAEVMDCWQTSCPRLTVWEDAQDERLVERFEHQSGQLFVKVTERGRQALAGSGRLIDGTTEVN